MRFVLTVIAVVCAACAGNGTGPLNAPASIAGSWSSLGPGQSPAPGGPEIITLTQSDTVITGSDSSAGQQSSVSGYYLRPAITLTLFGLQQHGIVIDTGKALDTNRIQLNGKIFYRQ